MFCPKCRRNVDQSAFCQFCGSAISKGISTKTILTIVVGSFAAMFLLCGMLGFVGYLIESPKKPVAMNTDSSGNPPQNTAPVPRQKLSPAPTIKPEATIKPASTEEPFSCDTAVRVVASKWEKGGFGTVALWKVTLRNLSKKTIGDFRFRTVDYSETGNTVGSGGVDSLLGKDTIQKILPGLSSRTFEVNDGFISDEAVRAGFEITDCREIG